MVLLFLAFFTFQSLKARLLIRIQNMEKGLGNVLVLEDKDDKSFVSVVGRPEDLRLHYVEKNQNESLDKGLPSYYGKRDDEERLGAFLDAYQDPKKTFNPLILLVAFMPSFQRSLKKVDKDFSKLLKGAFQTLEGKSPELPQVLDKLNQGLSELEVSDSQWGSALKKSRTFYPYGSHSRVLPLSDLEKTENLDLVLIPEKLVLVDGGFKF